MLFHQINFCIRVSRIYELYHFKNVCYDNIKATFKISNHVIIVNLSFLDVRYYIYIMALDNNLSLSQFSFPIFSSISEYQTRNIIIPVLSLYHC